MSDILRPPIAASQIPRRAARLRRAALASPRLRAVENVIAGLFWRVKARLDMRPGAQPERLSGVRREAGAHLQLPRGVDLADIEAAAMAMIGGRIAMSERIELRQAAIAVAAAAMARENRRVHVLCASAAMAGAFHAEFAGYFSGLGLDFAILREGQPHAERRRIYKSHVVVADIMQVATDHLRDCHGGLNRRSGAHALSHFLASGEAAREKFFCGPLDVALVDHFSTLAIDFSGRPVRLHDEIALTNERQIASDAVAVAGRLEPGRDFDLNCEGPSALTDHGRVRADRLCAALGPLWAIPSWREPMLCSAISVVFGVKPHADYAFPHGLAEFANPLVEERLSCDSLVSASELVHAKEQTGRRTGEIAAEMLVRQFLDDYRHLSGATAPAPGFAPDLWNTYALTSCRIGAGALSRRRMVTHVYEDRDAKWKAVGDIVSQHHSRSGEKCLLVARTMHESPETVRAQLPSSKREHFDIATRPEEIADLTQGAEPRVLFVDAEPAKWRNGKEAAALAACPEACPERHLSWDDAGLEAAVRTWRIRLLRRFPFPKAIAMRAALRQADRLDRRVARNMQKSRQRWEDAKSNAFGFTGNSE